MDAPPPPTAADLLAVYHKVTPPPPRSALDGPIAVAVLLLAGLLGSFAATNSDLWLHLASGRMVAGHQFTFGPDPFSANDGATWVNHAWFFDLLLYLVYKAAGGPMLVAVKALLVVVLAAILLAVRRPQGGALAPAAMTTLVLLAIAPLLLVRSTVASYLLFAVLVLMLHRWPLVRLRRATREKSWAFPATIGGLFLLWVNTDGGFVFGLLLLAVWTIGAIFQRGLPVGEPGDDPGEAAHSPGILAAALAAALVGCLINPYHVRAFRLPTELTALTLPAGLRGEPYFEQYYRSAFSNAHVLAVGPVAAGAFYLLFPLGLASFAVNAGGWRWRRVLAWAAFAWLGASFWRLTPYFAIVCGPAIVLNLQAYLSRRRAQWVEKPNIRAEHLRQFFAVAGRTLLLIALVALLGLAWPGWLGRRDDRLPASERLVTWRADPDPTAERLARRLAGWYESGALRPGLAKGFHVQPDFGFYCAWFCPKELSLFDPRLTAPPEVTADYLAARRSVAALVDPPTADRPSSPDSLFRKLGVTHMVLSGGGVLPAPPLVTRGLGWAVFTDPGRWPAWSIDGQGVICGWRDPTRRGPDRFAGLRLDPVRMAVGDLAEKAPAPPAEFPRPTPPTMWDQFRPPPSTPPDAFEAGLWLAYRNATVRRGAYAAIPLGQTVSRLARLAPDGLPDLAVPLLSAFPSDPVAARLQAGWQAAWRHSAEGRAGRAAAVLAVRSCRRAIRLNPDHPEAYGRLAQAYGDLDIDSAIGPLQLITAARQALARLAVNPGRRTALQEEFVLQEQLLKLYPQMVVPGSNGRAQPLDLMKESLERFVDAYGRLGPAVPSGDAAKQFEADLRRYQKSLEDMQTKVRERSDEYENRAHGRPPVDRVRIACQFGLVREALAVMQSAEPGQLDTGAVFLMANLLLLVGQAEDAHDLLQPIRAEEIPGDFQRQLRFLNVQTAAALGDYAAAIDNAGAMLPLLPGRREVERLAAEVLSETVFPDAVPAHPLTRVLTLPLWGGLWRNGQPAVVGDRPFVGDMFLLDGTIVGYKQYGDWLVRQGLLALEQGDPNLAQRRLLDAVGPSAPRIVFEDRNLALAWLELWDPR